MASLGYRQHGIPHLVVNEDDGPVARALVANDLSGKSEEAFDEEWLQQVLYLNPNLLPVREIDPIFGPLLPLCREMNTPVGPVDAVFMNPSGLMTIVECKLWRNPEARRKVVGQILDYANCISRWSFTQLEEAVLRARSTPDTSMFELFADSDEALDEIEFTDNVTRNLKRGRFLLLVVGDGIRESVEDIAEFLQVHGHLNFSFALVEQKVYRMPKELGDGAVIVPRTIARTVEIERAVVRLEDGALVAAGSEETRSTGDRPHRRSSITEQVFYEQIRELDPDLTGRIKEFLRKAVDIGLIVEPTKSGLALRSEDRVFNFGILQSAGTFRNYGIASVTDEIGHPEIGEEYLRSLAELLPDTVVWQPRGKFKWTVRKRDNSYVMLAECLAVGTELLDLIERTLLAIQRVQDG